MRMKTWRNLIDHHKPKSHLLSSWHIPEDVRFGGGGCREDFRPWCEKREINSKKKEGRMIPVQTGRDKARDEFWNVEDNEKPKIWEKWERIRRIWKCINNKSKVYKNMPKTGLELEWFINTELHVYIEWYEYTHARHVIGTHDCHLAFMQACHLVIMH